MKNEFSDLDRIQEPILKANPEVKAIIQRVLKLEKERLYLKSPRNITEDIVHIIKDTIQ